MRNRVRHWALVSAALVGVASAASAQDVDALKAKLEKKLAKDFVSAVNWTTDVDKARATAKESGKRIFAYFTRSYSP